MKEVHDRKTKHDVGKGSVEDYIQFHKKMIDAKDLDPYYPLLKQYADSRYMHDADRIQLALFFAMTYSAPSSVMLSRMAADGIEFNDEWWSENKYKLVFGPDRMRVKSNDMFIPAMVDWGKIKRWSNLPDLFTTKLNDHRFNYVWACQAFQREIRYMGAFASGLMVECVRYLTRIPLEKEAINWREAQSSRTGLFYVFDLPNPEDSTSVYLANRLFIDLSSVMTQQLDPKYLSLFNIESTLCIYKNFCRGHRYVGYYIERQRQEIEKMSKAYPDEDWAWLWTFRKDYFNHEYLRELKQ